MSLSNEPRLGNAERRQTELLQTLVELTPDPDELLHSLAANAANTDRLIEVLQKVNELNQYEERFPLDKIELLQRLIRIGVHPEILRNLLLPKDDDAERVREIANEVAREVGGIPALITLMEPRPERRHTIYKAILPTESDEYHRVMSGLSKVKREILPKQRDDEDYVVKPNTIPAWRYSLSSLLMGTHPNSMTRDQDAEQELQDTEIDDSVSNEACYVSIKPIANSCFMLRVVLPWGADVFRFSQEGIATCATFLTLVGPQSLPEVFQKKERYAGPAHLKMFRPEKSSRATYPRIFWENALR